MQDLAHGARDVGAELGRIGVGDGDFEVEKRADASDGGRVQDVRRNSFPAQRMTAPICGLAASEIATPRPS